MSNPLTKEEIFTAANEIAAVGQMPTIKSLRTQLGNRGSETTLLKYLKEWKHELLNRSTVGCVFCSVLEMENNTLQARLKNYILTCSELQATILSMIKDREVLLHMPRLQ